MTTKTVSKFKLLLSFLEQVIQVIKYSHIADITKKERAHKNILIVYLKTCVVKKIFSGLFSYHFTPKDKEV